MSEPDDKPKKVELIIKRGGAIIKPSNTTAFESQGKKTQEIMREIAEINGRQPLHQIMTKALEMIDGEMMINRDKLASGIGEFLKTQLDPFTKSLQEYSKQLNSPLVRMVDDLVRDMNLTIRVQPEIARNPNMFNSGLVNIERKIDKLVPEITDKRILSEMQEMRKTIESLQKEMETLRQGNKDNELSLDEINLPTKPPGRPVDNWNPAAFDILNDGKEDARKRAFKYWCKEQGFRNPTKDNNDAFKKAMKRERLRREGTK